MKQRLLAVALSVGLDKATPDVLVQPIYGTIYTGSSKKNAEHGGFSFADTNVGLMVSNPHLHSRVVKTPVATSQVAASILKALGIDPANSSPYARKAPKFCRSSSALRVATAGTSRRLPYDPIQKGVPTRSGRPFSHF